MLELTEMVEPPRAADDGIASAATVAASASVLAGLAAATRPAADIRIGDGNVTLEQIVRSELRGLLQSWLDANLPGIVERLVQNEIKRITRQAGDG